MADDKEKMMSPSDVALLEIKDVFEQARKGVDYMRQTRHHVTKAEVDLISHGGHRERAVVSTALRAAARNLADARATIAEAEAILQRVQQRLEKCKDPNTL